MSSIQQFLQKEDILKRVVKDMDSLGYVGEEENKLLGYLISMSRKLDEPLSGIVVSSSGAGKSKLVEIIQALTPAEDVVFASKLTPQSLYYMQKDFLKNKLLIIEERTGSELADYAIRTLQSKGSLSLAAAVRSQTVFFKVEGPVSVLETTTSSRLNLENISRCFILCLDESKEQTENIHRYQRLLKTKEGIGLKQRFRAIEEFHHSLQREIKSLPVIIPYAGKLTFPADTALSRRDNQKFLTLIEAAALLYQHQRKKITKDGAVFIEAQASDYRMAYNLFKKTYKNGLFYRHPRASLLVSRLNSIKDDIFSRRDLSKLTGWPDYQVRDNIKYLEEAGVFKIIQKSKGRKTLYRLNSDIELTKPEELEE